MQVFMKRFKFLTKNLVSFDMMVNFSTAFSSAQLPSGELAALHNQVKYNGYNRH